VERELDLAEQRLGGLARLGARRLVRGHLDVVAVLAGDPRDPIRVVDLEHVALRRGQHLGLARLGALRPGDARQQAAQQGLQALCRLVVVIVVASPAHE
jgi:hypothetical protein